MDDILEGLVSFFCPTSDSASACREFIQSHSQVLPPIGPLFYFLLFPLIFTVLFLYILSGTILRGATLTKGLRLAIGVSAFIFIVINGWYPIMLYLSEFWYIMIIIFFGAWYFLTKHKGGEGGKGGGGKGTMPGFGDIASGALGGAISYGSQKILRRGEETPEERIVTSKLTMLEGVLLNLEAAGNERAKAQFRERFTIMMGELENHELPNIEKEYGRETYLYLLKKYKPIIEDLKKRFKHK